MEGKPVGRETRTIALPDDSVEALFGSYDENLSSSSRLFNVRMIRTQGHDLHGRRGRGRPWPASSSVVEQLLALHAGGLPARRTAT